MLNSRFQLFSRFIFIKIRISQPFAYDMGVASFDQYLDAQLARGRAHFTREEALAELRLSPLALKAAIGRMAKKLRVANLRHCFYLILRPEDRVAGAPDPARWIPKQLRDLEIGRHRLQFVYQAPAAFTQVNQREWLGSMKSEAGFAKVAGVELTLLDCARYFHKSAGINGLAQIVKDIGERADAHKLADAAVIYENASVRRIQATSECARTLRQGRQDFIPSLPIRQATDCFTRRRCPACCQVEAHHQ
jgi:hypothetical protein